MIVGSLLLVAVALVLLGFGLVYLDEPLLYSSIGVSALAAVALVVGVRRLAATRAQRGVLAVRSGPGTWVVELGPGASASPDGPATPVAQAARPTGRATARPIGRATPRPVGRATVLPVPADPPPGDGVDEPVEQAAPARTARLVELDAALVVVDGLPRYHLDGCVRLVGADGEQLGAAEAVELGFTPCGVCRPIETLLGTEQPPGHE